MITPQQAEAESNFHLNGHCHLTIGLRGRIIVQYMLWRSNGRLKVHRKGQWRLPIKHGMYDQAAITEENCDQFHLEKTCIVKYEAERLRDKPIHELKGLVETGYQGASA